MTLAAATAAVNAVKSSGLVSWKSSGRLQQTVARCIELSGKGLHSGKQSAVRIWPELAKKGRYFDFPGLRPKALSPIPAFIDFAEQSPLCTALSRDGVRVRTVEHLLSALEAYGVDNCRIEIINPNCKDGSGEDCDFEVPILDGSAKQWIEAIEEVGLMVAVDELGNSCERLAPHLTEPVCVWRNDSFVAAIPLPQVHITYGIHFPVCAIGCQWFSSGALNDSFYVQEIASARTFCLYEEVEHMRATGLIKGGSLDNAIVCSAEKGWLNPPLRYHDEPCRHKVLDLVGDLSLFARFGNQGLPVSHIIAYKAGHAIHAEFVRRLNESFKSHIC